MLHLVTLALIIVELCVFKQTDRPTDRPTDRQSKKSYIHSVWSATPSTACYIQFHKVNIPFFLPYF